MPEPADLLITSLDQIVTCASRGPKRGDTMRDAGIIPHGAIAIRGDKIAAVGPSAEIEARFSARETLRAPAGTIMTPGLIDCHTHAVWGGDRLAEFEQRIGGATYLDLLGQGGGILSTMRATRDATVKQLAAAADARLAIMRMNGTTTAEIKTGYGLSLDAELNALKAMDAMYEPGGVEIVPTFLGAHAIPPEFAGDAEGYTCHVIEDMLPAVVAWYNDSPFAHSDAQFSVDVFCERNAFDLDQSRRILTAARDLGLAIRAHVDEFTDLGGVKMAVELGALSVDHLDVTGPDGIAALAASDTVGVILPAVNFNLGGTHFADARAMIDAGAIVALATDLNPGSAPCYSLPMVMAIACRYQKLLPAEAINAVTINAAHALGLGRKVGSLEAGKQADLVLFNTHDYRAIAYEFGLSRVASVMANGTWIFHRSPV